MSEQDGLQTSTKSQRSLQARKQNDAQKGDPLRPFINKWLHRWEQQGQTWRTEPEIDAERQRYLADRRSIRLDRRNEIYPFKDIQLTRADVEWLLATHENGSGPLIWEDLSQREREGLNLYGADLQDIYLGFLPLAKSNFGDAHLERATFSNAHLEGANFIGAHLERAHLGRAHLEHAYLINAHLEGASLSNSHLEGALLLKAHLEGASLYNTFLDAGTRLDGIILANQDGVEVALLDVHWDDANIAVVDWASLSILGNERASRQLAEVLELPKDKTQLLEEYLSTTRAYRQLSVVLRNQGLSEDAARFAYRSQLMQRKAFWYQKKIWQFLLSHFLDLLAGYGYKPWRSFVAYLIVIIGFATMYFLIGHTVGLTLSPLGSFVFSMTSFHGRGFFPGGIGLDDPLTVLAALEAFVGLLIEVTFIATLTQRLFGK